MKKCCPISNVPLISKLAEEVLEHVEHGDLHDNHQSILMEVIQQWRLLDSTGTVTLMLLLNYARFI